MGYVHQDGLWVQLNYYLNWIESLIDFSAHFSFDFFLQSPFHAYKLFYLQPVNFLLVKCSELTMLAKHFHSSVQLFWQNRTFLYMVYQSRTPATKHLYLANNNYVKTMFLLMAYYTYQSHDKHGSSQTCCTELRSLSINTVPWNWALKMCIFSWL